MKNITLKETYDMFFGNISRSNDVEEFLNEDVDPDFARAFDSPTIKVVTLMIYLLMTPIGCVLNFLVIHYEQFGGDPQKRSISNQIIAFIAAIEILSVLISEHILLTRVFAGCLQSEIGTLFWFCNTYKHALIATLIAIALTYRTVKVFSFRRVASLNDNALSVFILAASVMNNFLFVIVRYMFGEAKGKTLIKTMTCITYEEEHKM